MENKYEKNAKILKALSDTNRLRIIDLLSCGEMCACHILENFNFTQPTLSHHMKVLIDCGLVEARKDGIWNLYKLNLNNANMLVLFFMNLITENDECEEKDNKCPKSEDNK
ncbi:ArsR/SmtB family transcription factor [Clostridium saccharoperbutylacetonicum]